MSTFEEKARWIPFASFLLLLVSLPVHAAENPDDLYAKGRFREAQAAYRKLDMDHPTDLRYRYDRGCAAYQGGSFDEAQAAFTSVARRAQEGDVRFRALYNLGNTAYKKNDFAASRDAFIKALALRPDDPDARHNLDLALKALKKQGERKEQGRPDKGAQRKESTESGKGKEGGEKKGGPDRQDGQDQKDGQGSSGQQGDPPKGQEGNTGKQETGPAPGSPGQQEEGRQDLAGELKGRHRGTGQDQRGKPQGMSPAAAMERARAEALLDNTRENRSRGRELRGGQTGSLSVGSGKEW